MHGFARWPLIDQISRGTTFLNRSAHQIADTIPFVSTKSCVVSRIDDMPACKRPSKCDLICIFQIATDRQAARYPGDLDTVRL